MIDSHAHIYLDQFDEDREEMLERCIDNDVTHILMPNIDHTSIDAMLEVESKNSNCISMMGLHPCSVKNDFEKELYLVENWLNTGKFCAVGEIGTDLYWDKTYFEQQKEAFNIQCELALKHKLPIVIHCRESIDETIELVKPFSEKGLMGVFHCFTGTVEQAQKITSMNFYLGIGGVATFKNGGLDKVLPDIGYESLMLETDSPYLAPKPYRGKRNEPSYLPIILNRIAEILGDDINLIREQTIKNTRELFQV